ALAARLCGETGRARKGMKLIEDAWTLAPHPDLAEVWLDMIEGESGYDRAARARVLASRNIDHIESRILLARGAIGARDWAAAREALAPYAGPDAKEVATQRVCELMAEIEEGEFGDRGASRSWLTRALHAPEDPQWTGTGYRSSRWSPVNPVTGEFDALEWSALVAAFAHEAAAGQTASEPEAVQDAVPVPQPEAGLSVTRDEQRKSAAASEVLAFHPPLPDDPGPEETAEEAQEGERKW
ncbi:MAG: hypothetical protein Q7U42_01755, partial [Parvibaculum sp.]|nr:hypothetical protein [Parvibaculum sp.]